LKGLAYGKSGTLGVVIVYPGVAKDKELYAPGAATRTGGSAARGHFGFILAAQQGHDLFCILGYGGDILRGYNIGHLSHSSIYLLYIIIYKHIKSD